MPQHQRELAIEKVQDELLRLYRTTGFQTIIEDMTSRWLAGLLTPVQDPWRVLGVSPDDPVALVDQVFRLKVKFYHPDNPKTGDRRRFEMILNAYQDIVSMKAEGVNEPR